MIKDIKFYCGEENGVVIEKDVIDESIFKEQYTKAIKLIDHIVEKPSNDIPSIVAFCGDRGEGKSSCMFSVREMLESQNVDWMGENATKNIKAKKFELLDTIDPAFFDEEHNVLELVLGQMYTKFKENYPKLGEEIEPKKKKLVNSLSLAFQKTKKCLSQTKQPREKIYNALEDLDSLVAAEGLRKSFDQLVEKYLEFYEGKDFLVLTIDDIDLNIDGAYEMAEQIRKYLLSEKCLILVSLNINQLIDVIANYLDNKAALNRDLGVEAMAMKYVTKLIPLECRIVMPKVYDLCDKVLSIYKSHQDDNPTKYNSVKEAVVKLIYNKSRYLFYNSKGGVSPIVPNNLRSLRHLIGMLFGLDDFVENQVSEANKHIFKAYFFQTWIHQLSKRDQKFAELLVKGDDPTIVNKLVVSYLAQFFPEENKNKDSMLGDILNPSNYSYNLSVGDVFYLISILEKSNVENELRLMLFFIRSFYGMQLYDYYDVITENEKELFPVDSSQGEVYKSDAWFKKTNVLQKLVNGVYFTYDADDFLPATANRQMFRDLKLINAQTLRQLASKDLLKDMDRYDRNEGMTPEEKQQFERKFRATELIVLTTKRPNSRRAADRFNRMKRNLPEPYHLADVNRSTGYLVFDVLAPFGNIINLKFAYGRLSYLRKEQQEDNFYQFALKHEWSLLRQMMEYVDLKEYNEKHPEQIRTIDNKEKLNDETLGNGLMRLMSNATIRNGEVLLAMMEMIQSRRTNMHNVRDNMKVLAQFYKDIINSSMQTYKNTSTDRTYIIRFAFLEAIIALLEKEGNELFRLIYESGVESSKAEPETVKATFRDFFDRSFNSKKRSAIRSEFEKMYMSYSLNITDDDWQSMFPDEKKSYPKDDIVAAFGKSFYKITGMVKTADEYVDEEDE